MVTDRIARALTIARQFFVCGLGVAAIVWGGYVLPIFWRQSGLEQIATHVIAGDPFKANVLAALISPLDVAPAAKWDRPSAVRNSAVIRLRILENAMVDDDPKTIDQQMTRLGKTINVSLANTPADPFLWLVLFWLKNTQDGFSAKHLSYLRMSYSLGPDEGWIGIRRNRVALAIFSQLPSDLAEKAKAEFVRLVDSEFYGEAANILTGPGWGIRDVLLPGLKAATELNRQLFARTVFNLGYDIVVPGVERPNPRPWQ